MARLRNDGDVAELFNNVFTEGPLEELINCCDVVTSASLISSSNIFLQSAKLSATLHKSRPFDLPCILQSHPARRPWEYNEACSVGSECMMMPLDRPCSDALMPNDFNEQRTDSNGDWIVMVGRRANWNLINVYTHRKIALPPLPGVEATDSPLTFTDRGGYLELQKISICQVPTAAGSYKDYSLVAIFNATIVVLLSYFTGSLVLENQFQNNIFYCDAIIHEDLVFAVFEDGCVYAWDPISFGPLLFRTPPEFLELSGQLDVAEEQEANDPANWWLARSPHGSRIVLVYTRGVKYDNSGIHPIHAAADDIIHHGRTLQTYASGFHCMVFSMDTRMIHLKKRWRRVHDLGKYSLFLRLNYPINIAVAAADDALGKLAIRNCVYTSHHALGYANRPLPEICRFSLNAIDATVSFSTNTDWEWSATPLWFIPNLANAVDWH